MIDQRFAKRCFIYDPDTGSLIWKIRPASHFETHHGQISFNARYPGNEAGSVQKHHRTGKSYRSVELNGRRYMNHQIICLIVSGEFCEQVDHENGDGTDNRLLNLRFVNKTENSKNQRRRHDNTTGVTGVTWDGQQCNWRSRINDGCGRRISKRFDNLLDATAWRKSAENRFGYHSNHGVDRAL